jgi:uncharacterized membrane protein SpoIIM required for sporulation
LGTRPFGPKRIFFDRILRKSYWTWRKHPSIIIPTILAMALLLVEESIVSLATVILETLWASTGTLLEILTQYRSSGLLGLLQYPASSPSLIPTFFVSIFLLVLVGTVGIGYIYSCEYGIYIEAWNNETVPIRSLLANGSRNWKAMALTFLLSSLLTWGPTLIGLGLIVGASLSLNRILLLGSVLLLAPLFVASAILSVFTIYTYPAVVADQLSGLSAIRQSFRVSSHNLGITLTYLIIQSVSIGLLLLVAIFASGLGLVLGSTVEVVLIFILLPIFHLTKTMIYFHARPSVPEMAIETSPPIWRDLFETFPRAAWTRVKVGLSEGARFLIGPRNLPFHAATVGIFILGVYLGDYVSVNGWASFLVSTPGYQPGHGNPELTQVFLPSLGFDIFFHNWIVSFATVLSGFGFGAPSSILILYTGFTVGRLIVPQISSFTMFAAIILPHGIIEIPSFLLAGSMGARLGYAIFKSRVNPGPDSESYLSKTLRTAIYVATGLLPFFFVAGMIEGDITPIIARMFGWTF